MHDTDNFVGGAIESGISVRTRLEVLEELYVKQAAELSCLALDVHAVRMLAFVSLATSPQAQALLERERPKLAEAIKVLGLKNEHALYLAEIIRGQQTAARATPTGLPGFLGRLVFDCTATTEKVLSPWMWTAQGAMLAGGIAAASWLVLNAW